MDDDMEMLREQNRLLRSLVRDQGLIIIGILELFPDEYKRLEAVQRAIAICDKMGTLIEGIW